MFPKADVFDMVAKIKYFFINQKEKSHQTENSVEHVL
jgi:hypothetical protein